MAQQQALILEVNSIKARLGAMEASRALDQVHKSAKKATTGIERLEQAGRKMKSVGKAMTVGLTVPLAAVAAASVKAAADMEALTMALDTMTGSSEETAVQLERLKAVARAPGLGFKEAIQGSVNLQAVGFAATDAERALSAFGNAIATTGGGKAELDRVIFQMTQMAAAGKVLGRDLRPIITTAPVVSKVLMDMFGTVDAEQIQDQAGSFDNFFNALIPKLEELPSVAGGAKNAMDNLSDSFFRARAAIGEKLLPVIVPMVDGIANMLEGIENLNPQTVQWSIALGAVAAVAGPLLLVVGSLTTAVAGLAAAGASLMTVFAVGAPLIVGLGALAAIFVKNKLEAAAFRGEMERLGEIGSSDPVKIGANLDETRAELEASQRRLKALKLDLEGKGGSTVSKERLQEQFDAELATMVALSAEVNNLEANLARVQTITPAPDSVLNPRTAEEAAKAVRALVKEIDYFVNKGAQVELVGNFQAPIAKSVEFMGVGARRLEAEFQKVQAIAERFGLTWKEVIAQVQDPALRENLAKMAEDANKQVDKLQGTVVNLSVAFSGSMVDALTDGEDAFKRFADYAIDQLLRIAAQMALFKGLELLFAGSTGGIGATLGGLFAESFGGARAHGGPVQTGKSYLVGEQGPELFTPKQSGNIAPNGAAVSFDFSGFPAPSNPLAMARDAEWMRFLTESLENAKSGGYSFQGAG